MNDSRFIASTLQGLVNGDLNHFDAIQQAPSKEIYEAFKQIKYLQLNREGLLKVLHDWQQGKLSEEQVQSWASFIRHGYVGGKNEGPIQSVPIDYDPAHEDTINEILARLDELGDIIDGEISSNELQEMMRLLRN